MKGTCPTCRKPYEIKSIDDLPGFPFCSPRCRLIDLGRWVDGVNAIPGPSASSEQAESADVSLEDEAE
jgi:endogenous inhibitor of DNA gyrase (YacG/DUF329 family)